MALGPVTGGWIGDHYGMRASYQVATFIFLFSMTSILFIKNQPLDKHDPEAPPVRLWNNKGFVSFLGMVAFAVFAMYLSQPLTPNFLEGVRKFSLSDTGWIFSAGALGNALFAIGFSRLEPRKGFLYSQALVALFALIMWKGLGLPLFMFGYFLLGGFRAARPMMQAQGRELVHESQMGLMYGTLETVNAAIFIVTPPLAGLLFVIEPTLVYPLAIGLIAVSIFVTFIFSRRKVQYA
jgi:MFS family permease